MEDTRRRDGRSHNRWRSLLLVASASASESLPRTTGAACVDDCNNGTDKPRNPKNVDDHAQSTDGMDGWMEKYRELKAFASEKGHCNVPRSFGALGQWVSHQRRKMRKYEQDQADNEKLHRQMKMLKDIGLTAFIGKGNSAKVNGLLLGSMDAWEEQYTKLLRYREVEGHCNVPTKSTLGRWVSRQRASYRKYCVIEQGRLKLRGGNDLHDRFRRLASIGFNFNIGTGNGGRKKLSKMP